MPVKKSKDRKHLPYVLYKKTLKDGCQYWYAKQWDEWRECWGTTKATGVKVEGVRENRRDAEETAAALFKKPETSKELGKQNFIDLCMSCWTKDSEYALEYLDDTGIPLASYYVSSNYDGLRKWVKELKGFTELEAPVEKITNENISNWRKEAIKQGCGPRRIKAVEQALRVPIRWYISRGVIKMDDPFAPRIIKKEREGRRARALKAKAKSKDESSGPWKTITFPELVRILDSEYPDARVLFAVACAALCGLRRGEIRALEWQDIDEAARVIHVRRNVVDTEAEEKGPKWESYRDVMLPDALLPAYTRLKAKMKSVMSVGKTDYVLFNENSPDSPIGIQTLRLGFAKLFTQIGIPAEERKRRGLTGLHALRHSYASLLADANVAQSEVRGFMGHSSEKMTAAYTHAMKTMDVSRAVFDAAIDRARQETE